MRQEYSRALASLCLMHTTFVDEAEGWVTRVKAVRDAADEQASSWPPSTASVAGGTGAQVWNADPGWSPVCRADARAGEG